MPRLGSLLRPNIKRDKVRRSLKQQLGVFEETYLAAVNGVVRIPGGKMWVHDLAGADGNGIATYGAPYQLRIKPGASIDPRPNWKVNTVTIRGIKYIDSMDFDELERIGYDAHQTNPLDPSLKFSLIEHLQNLQSFPNGNATVRVMPSIYKKANGEYDIFATINEDILTGNVPSANTQVVVCLWLQSDNTIAVTVSSEESVDTDLKLDTATALTLINECAAAAPLGAVGIWSYIIWFDTTALTAKNKFHDLRGIIGAGGSDVAKPNFGDGVIKTLASDIVSAGDDRHLIIASESDTADDLIEITGLSIGDKVILRADTGDTITVKHNAGGATIKIHLYDNADVILDELNPLELVLVSATVLAQPLDISSTGSAPSSAKYVVTESSASLSNEITIPGIESSFDIQSQINYAAATGISEEYDTATTGLTWTSAPDTVDSDTTIPSHLYVEHAAGGAIEYCAYRAWTPSGACEAVTKVAVASNATSIVSIFGLLIGDSTLANFVSLSNNRNPTVNQILAHTNSGSFTQRGSTWTAFSTPVWMKIANDGSNNWTWFFSDNGVIWNQVATFSFSFTIARVGYRFATNGITTLRAASDFLRTND